ncbi:TraR/DksA family transcriptional regulator [Demequina sp. B12]|uniref:TraR/DksA family transcriptional regulator n=1 Tax=Demequina sp. B12 TaxID=2992757 RepID=UPI00237B6781|nr:TraR/DksA family transcriptional regulator [Demequina sp. B12]MDE0573320.1 TraR/DksA family transcriptional regulator [Demequina sp. B12]
MTSTDFTVVVIDPAELKAADAKKLAVRDGDEPWKLAELRELVATLNDDAQRLAAEYEGVEHDLDDLLHTSEGAGDDQADIGSSALEREHEMSIVNNTRDMLEQTSDALRRVRKGTYGTCASCGEGIGKARLQAFPRATHCVTCKQREERR